MKAFSTSFCTEELEEKINNMNPEDYTKFDEVSWTWYRRYNKTRETVKDKKRKMKELQVHNLLLFFKVFTL